ncbi:SRPBCC family protein [Patulibacter defluvii]|uniref:SRPBCC family protein n=1 Tax=Patulibacter defluvii TaxID=3095358 RepID=UPI002A766327|nr:SRPBCC domain-containing protein [Patulibacter sp. DM4]
MSSPEQDDPTERVVRVQTEVPTGPEQTWRAIATAAGISGWFTAAQVEEREGGRIVTDHGPFGTSEGTVTTWDPPHRFVYEERDWNPDDPAAPVWATEIVVEAQEGGHCVVRLASGFFHGGEGWEDQLGGTDEGWARGMVNLRLYLTHFADRPTANVFLIGSVGADRSAAAARLLRAAGLEGVAVGDPVAAAAGRPPLEGVVEHVGPTGVVVRGPDGLHELDAWQHATTSVSVRAYLHGDDGVARAREEDARWSAWLREVFPDFSPPGSPVPPA